MTLALLGYSALFQGKHDAAEHLFDESASVDVPDRTSSVHEPAQARAALRRGDPSQAFRILHSYVQELLDTDYTDLARNAAIEFINLMAALGRLPEAEHVRSYLLNTGDFGSRAASDIAADSPHKVVGGEEPAPHQVHVPARDLDARQALEYMRDTFDELRQTEGMGLSVIEVMASR